MKIKKIQLATCGADTSPIRDATHILKPVKNIIFLDSMFENKIKIMKASLESDLGIPTKIEIVNTTTHHSVYKKMAKIIKEHQNDYEILANVTGGTKEIAILTLSAAFIMGIRSFYISGGKIFWMPFSAIGLQEILGDTRIQILQTLKELGGVADSLSEIALKTGLNKSLITYHIQGSSTSKGLLDLGLVTTTQKKAGVKMRIHLTDLGEAILELV